MTLNPMQEELCRQSQWDFSDLSAFFINCTLKRSPEVSHTEGLAGISIEIMRRQGVAVDSLRAIDQDIATGVWPDMTEHGWEADDWPAISERVMASDILVLCTPIWLGEKSSICTKVIERLYGNSHLLNESGQYAFYGRVAGCLVTGNEDGVKHCAMNILYSLQHLGYVIRRKPTPAGSARRDPAPLTRSGFWRSENDFTNRNVTFMTWNLLHSHANSRIGEAFRHMATSGLLGTRDAVSIFPIPIIAESDLLGTRCQMVNHLPEGVRATYTFAIVGTQSIVTPRAP